MGEQVVAIHNRLLNRQRDIFNECRIFFSASRRVNVSRDSKNRC